MTTQISNMDDVIDSRDVIARIEELQGERQALADAVDEAKELLTPTDEEKDADAHADALDKFEDAESALKDWDESDEAAELKALEALAEDAEGYAADWKYGEALIRDSYFKEYAQDLAEDIGAIDKAASWPNTCIDWDQAARELQMDYTQVDFDGVTYWIR